MDGEMVKPVALGIEPEGGSEAAKATDNDNVNHGIEQENKMTKKKIRKVAAPKRTSKRKLSKTPRARKIARGLRMRASSVCVFVKPLKGLQPRAQAILNAIEKIGEGTAEQVAKAVNKKDYNGKQDLVYLSKFFLRRFLNRGAVKVKE